MAWHRNSSNYYQLAVRTADVGVSAFVCECDVFKPIFLCGCIRDNSIVSFLIAFGFMCLQDSGVATRSVIAILWGTILILTFWCIWTLWSKQEPSCADKPKRRILTFEEDHVRKEKGFKFTREESDITKSQLNKRQVLRSRTLSSLKTASIQETLP